MTTVIGQKSHEIEILLKKFFCTVHMGYRLLEIRTMKWEGDVIMCA